MILKKHFTRAAKSAAAFAICISILLSTPFAVTPVNASEESTQRSESLSLPSRYDGRKLGIITPVKDQGTSNLCWAYSTVAAAEAAILKSGIDKNANRDNLYLNPNAAAYRVFKRTSDPLGNTDGDWQSVDYTSRSGDPLKIVKLFSMWWAPVEGKDATANPYDTPSYRLENAFYIPNDSSDKSEYIQSVKEAVYNYGAVTFQYNNLRETEYYNPKNEQGSQSSPHACTIIGWDDSIPKESFTPGGASQNGGWLVKNSYNSLPYFWLSYDNTSSVSYAFTFAEKDKYDYNYYYDGSIDDFSLRNDKTLANVFQAQKGDGDGHDEYLKAVNVGVSGKNVTVEATVYKHLDYPFGGQANVPVSGGEVAAVTKKTFAHGGYVTLELENPVLLEKDEWFSVICKVSSPNSNAKIITAYKNGKNLTYAPSSDSWSKLSNYVGRIKAYTKVSEKPAAQKGTLEGNFTNLIILARFSDEDEFVNNVYEGVDVRTITNNTYNKSDFSVGDYYKTASGGKLRPDSVFLFNADCSSIQLSKPRGYYAEYSEQNPDGYRDKADESIRMSELRDDWANAVNRAIANGAVVSNYDGSIYYDFSELDKNGDSRIDAISLIYKYTVQNISVGWSSPLWNYQFTNYGISVSAEGKTITSGKYVQLTNSYNFLHKDKFGNIMLSSSVATHEMGHVLGLLDLYNSSGTSPVYYMSLMAKHMSPIPQSVSVKEKEALGWIDENRLPTLKRDGEYTVSLDHVEGDAPYGYKIELPDSGKTIYLEYRSFTSNGDKYDNQAKELYKADGTKMKGLSIVSGLVCYKADSDVRFPSNMYASSPRWSYEVLGGTYSTKSDAAVTVGNIQWLTGDICVEVLQMDESTLTFAVSGIKDASHEHTGGTATHTKRAICELCGEEYGDLLPYISGDVNADGKVNLSDILLYKKYIISLVTESEIDTVNADFNSDGKLNAKDILLLKREIAGLN